jgi:hypothetical protein
MRIRFGGRGMFRSFVSLRPLIVDEIADLDKSSLADI